MTDAVVKSRVVTFVLLYTIVTFCIYTVDPSTLKFIKLMRITELEGNCPFKHFGSLD